MMNAALRRYFWDYSPEKLNNIPCIVTAQRFVNFWDTIQERFFAGEIDKETLKFILLTIKKNLKEIKFNDFVKKEVLEYLICKI